MIGGEKFQMPHSPDTGLSQAGLTFETYQIRIFMTSQRLAGFKVIGISVRTTNQNGKSAQDIPALWAKFMGEGTLEKIPNRLSDDLYCVYTDYERDHTRPYTTILGCRVSTLESVPEGMVGKTIPAGDYVRYLSKGNLREGAVIGTWHEIWGSDLPRKYTADFEIYGKRAQRPENAEVDIFVAIHK